MSFPNVLSFARIAFASISVAGCTLVDSSKTVSRTNRNEVARGVLASADLLGEASMRYEPVLFHTAGYIVEGANPVDEQIM